MGSTVELVLGEVLGGGEWFDESLEGFTQVTWKVTEEVLGGETPE